jgi:hypothetical protein
MLNKSLKNQTGNMAIMLVFLITIAFAIAGLSIDTSFYFLKRDQLQHLADNIALSAATNLPIKAAVESKAEQWYDSLRIDINGSILAPDRSLEAEALTILFNENTPSDSIAYKVNSVVVTLKEAYQSQAFPILGSSLGLIPVVGSSVAHITPTDIVLIIENSGSFVSTSQNASVPASFGVYSSTTAQRYANQCFSPPWVNFKKGLLAFYDSLSQIETVRVGVITMLSRSGEPYILADFGATEIGSTMLERDSDQPHHHSTRCFAAMGEDDFPIPAPAIQSYGSTWEPDASRPVTLLTDAENGDFSIADSSLLTREVIWGLQAGYSTSSGFIAPQHKYQDHKPAVDLAKRMLKDTRRDDSLPVVNRNIVIFTDDAGYIPEQGLGPERNLLDTQNVCDYWKSHPSNVGYASDITLSIVYYGHSTILEGHSPNSDEIVSLRVSCNNFSETSTWVLPAQPSNHFWQVNAPISAQALKQVELRK